MSVEPAPPAPPAAPEPPTPRVALVIPVRTILLVLLVLGVVALGLLALGALLSIFVAGVLALGLDPIVSALERRGWPRGRAALVVFAGLFVAAFLIVAICVVPLWSEIRDFLEQVPAYWADISSSDAFKSLMSDANRQDVESALRDLVSGVPEAATTVLGAAGGAFGSVLSIVTLTFLALFLLTERRTITDWLFGFAPPAAEARWRPVLEESIAAVSSSLIGNVAISLVAGTVAGVSAWLLGLPFPLVLAMIAAFLDLIPQIGATIAAVILVAVALTVGTTEAIIMLLVQIVYQQVENYVVYPLVYRRAVELSPLTTIAAVLVAGALLGVVGAILAVPFAAVLKIVIREWSAPRRARMAALRET